MDDTYSRRSVIGATGAAAAALLAGCSSGNSGDGRRDDREYLDTEPEYGNWFNGVDSYVGTVDWTGRDEVTVTVGYDQYAYDPAAVAVSPGTTVVWEWNGMGGGHNVVSDGDGPLESELVHSEGHTYSYTFAESGLFPYKCTPHETLGMRGAVYVE